MNIGKLLRIALLVIAGAFACLSIPHWDIEAVPSKGITTTHFKDLSSGEIFEEGTLDLRFLGFVASAFVAVLVYGVRFARSKRMTI